MGKPPMPRPRAIPPDRFQPNNTLARATSLGVVLHTTIARLALSTAKSVEYFKFRAARVGKYQASAPGIELRIFNSSGRLLDQSSGSIVFVVPKVGTQYYVETLSARGKTVATYSLKIGTYVVPKPIAHAVSVAPHPAGPVRSAKQLIPPSVRPPFLH